MLKSINKKVALVAALALTASTSAFAALPTNVTGAFTQMQTDGGEMIDAGWPILLTVSGGIILMKLFKKVLGRST